MEFWWNCASIWECSLKRGRIRKESGERERESRVLVRGTFCRTLDEMQERIWTSRRGGVRYLRISEAVGRSRWLDEEVCFLTLKCDKIVLIIFFAPGDNCQASSLLLGKREKERLKMWIDDGILAIVSLQSIYICATSFLILVCGNFVQTCLSSVNLAEFVNHNVSTWSTTVAWRRVSLHTV